jgi:hypothetical protein
VLASCRKTPLGITFAKPAWRARSVARRRGGFWPWRMVHPGRGSWFSHMTLWLYMVGLWFMMVDIWLIYDGLCWFLMVYPCLSMVSTGSSILALGMNPQNLHGNLWWSHGHTIHHGAISSYWHVCHRQSCLGKAVGEISRRCIGILPPGTATCSKGPRTTQVHVLHNLWEEGKARNKSWTSQVVSSVKCLVEKWRTQTWLSYFIQY